MSHPLELILLLLAAAVVAIIVCRLVRLPPILGYLAVGIAVGPHAMGWVPDNANVRDLAGKTDLLAFAENLRACRALVTNDTGGMHLAPNDKEGGGGSRSSVVVNPQPECL